MQVLYARCAGLDIHKDTWWLSHALESSPSHWFTRVKHGSRSMRLSRSRVP